MGRAASGALRARCPRARIGAMHAGGTAVMLLDPSGANISPAHTGWSHR